MISGWPLELSVGWPPSLNHCYRLTRYGPRLTAEAQSYQENVARRIRAMSRGAWEAGQKLVILAWYFKPDRRVRDVINLHKVLPDGVKDGLGIDDQWFLWRDQDFTVDKANPRVELSIAPKEMVDAEECGVV